MKRSIFVKKRTWLAVLLVLAACCWGGAKYHKTKVEAEKIKDLVPYAVKKGDFVEKVQATGTVQPENRVPLAPTVGGRVEEVLVHEGDPVKKGQLIAWISSNERAALLDTVRMNSTDPEDLKRVQEAYNRMPLVSPIEGSIIKRSAEPGQTVTPEREVVVLSDRLIVKAEVDETDMGGVHEGQKVEFFLDAFPDAKHEGRVVSVARDSSKNDNVNVYEVKILPLGRIPELRSGMTADIYIITEVKHNVLSLPKRAVTYKEGDSFVTLKTKDGKKTDSKKVKVGKSNELSIEVLSGVEENETVYYSTDSVKKENITFNN
jgi:macrolide-specific efflux system membrane fusion protein